MSKYKNIIIICPAYGKSGGAEALHQLAFYLRKKKQVHQFIYVNFTTFEIVKAPTPLKFRWYNVISTQQFIDDPNSLVIVPETMIAFLNNFQFAQKAIWWLSVNYGKIEENTLTSDYLHLAQSHYAFNFLETHGIIQPKMLSDFIVHYKIPDFVKSKKKKPIVIYDPRKKNNAIEKIISDMSFFNFKPIEKLDRIRLAFFFKQCSYYIDLGINPGKDRIPREVVANNRRILISNIGAASNAHDFPFSFEYKLPLELPIDGLILKTKEIIHVLNMDHFSQMQQSIKEEKKVFNNEINTLFALNGAIEISLVDKCRLIFFDLLDLIQLKLISLKKYFLKSKLHQ